MILSAAGCRQERHPAAVPGAGPTGTKSQKHIPRPSHPTTRKSDACWGPRWGLVMTHLGEETTSPETGYGAARRSGPACATSRHEAAHRRQASADFRIVSILYFSHSAAQASHSSAQMPHRR
jgi:hypothetical protein